MDKGLHAPRGYYWGHVHGRTKLHLAKAYLFNTTAVCGVSLWADDMRDEVLVTNLCRKCCSPLGPELRQANNRARVEP